MAQIGIIGAGQAGLQLGFALLGAGHEVTIVSNQTPDQMLAGRVTSSQCMFDMALANERALGVDFWDEVCPPVEGISLALLGEGGDPLLGWSARLDAPARSVDQRLKMPRWIEAFEARGGLVRIADAGVAEVEAMAAEMDLVLIGSGKGEIGRLFERDAAKSPFDKPLRALALTYVHGMTPREEHSAVDFSIAPGVGEYFVFPALTLSGPCDIMVFEGLPGGPMDIFDGRDAPAEHLAKSLGVLKAHFPAQFERSTGCALTDPLGVLSGRFAPTVRKPVLTLPSGATVLGLGDTVCLNDPITGQGSNNASKCAAIYADAIIERGEGPFDAAWMQATFDRYWAYARMVVEWTNGMLLPPPPHIERILAAAAEQPRVAHWFVNNFNDPAGFFPVIADPEATDAFLAREAA